MCCVLTEQTLKWRGNVLFKIGSDLVVSHLQLGLQSDVSFHINNTNNKLKTLNGQLQRYQSN